MTTTTQRRATWDALLSEALAVVFALGVAYWIAAAVLCLVGAAT